MVAGNSVIGVSLSVCSTTGITIIRDLTTQARSVSIGIYIRSGSAHETAQESGVSHFLEHLVFKGLVNERSEITEAMADLGSHSNAYTTDEHTSFYATCLPEVANETLTLMLQLLHPKFTKDDVALERAVILEEMRQYRDDPGYAVHEKGLKFFSPRHPLTKPIIGNEASLKKLTKESIERFFFQRYQPQRIVVVACGACANCDVEGLLAKHANHLKSAVVENSAVERFATVKARRGVQRISKRGILTSHLVGFWPGVAENDPRKFALELWCDIIGAGSRAAWKLVEPGIADSVGLSCEPRIDTGYVMLSAHGNHDRMPEIEAELGRILLDSIVNPITEDELNQSKAMTHFALASSSETPASKMSAHGEHWLTHGTPYPLDTEQAAFASVTLADVNQFAKNFPLSDAALTILSPE